MSAWQDVGQVLVGPDGAAKGVVLKDGTEIRSKVVLSNATPYVTFRNLTPQVTERETKHRLLCDRDATSDSPQFPVFFAECPSSRIH